MLAEAADLMNCLMLLEPRFEYEAGDTTSKLMASMIAWVWRAPQYNYLGLDFDKGLWLMGPLGTGKTTLLLGWRRYQARVCARYMVKPRKDDYRLTTLYMSASEISNAYAADGASGLKDVLSPNYNVIIDEMGREPCPANSYGTKLNVIQHVLQVRYDHRRECVTHVTTNMELSDVKERYGAYVADRCKEMFNFVRLEGGSKR